MDTVSEAAMATAMAYLGGVAVVHSNTEAHAQAFIVCATKCHRLPFVPFVPIFSPTSTPTPNDFMGHDHAFVTEGGNSLSKLVRVAVAADAALPETPATVSEYMCPAPCLASASFSFEQATAFLQECACC
ncbi:hypothetical protein ZWY2020_017850 [Hordeum vulgare]|nr:hypothetical protein ZWY2020_017850 [Hordeum vulgare]